jgi:uncharacterized protein YijF (DUF1287 family)
MKTLVTLTACLVIFTGADAAEKVLGIRIVEASRQQIGVTTDYDPSYRKLKYPGGDVPLRTGVCSDVIVRALRTVGIDLQREVHEDMWKNFSVYPQRWGLKAPDKNIDHRRVPNLMRYLERHHVWLEEKLTKPYVWTYAPGDIVAWNLGGGITHIGIVSDKKSGQIPLIIHNIGSGTKEEDILFKYQVIGHYRLRAAARE